MCRHPTSAVTSQHTVCEAMEHGGRWHRVAPRNRYRMVRALSRRFLLLGRRHPGGKQLPTGPPRRLRDRCGSSGISQRDLILRTGIELAIAGACPSLPYQRRFAACSWRMPRRCSASVDARFTTGFVRAGFGRYGRDADRGVSCSNRSRRCCARRRRSERIGCGAQRPSRWRFR